jgi:hypothetical protein
MAKRTTLDLWKQSGLARAAGLTGICYQKEVAEKITAEAAASKSNTLFATAKRCVWLGAVTSTSLTTRFTMGRYSYRVTGLAGIATVSTPNT